MDKLAEEIAGMKSAMEGWKEEMKTGMDETMRSLTDKIDHLLERGVTKEQMNDRLNPAEKRISELEKAMEGMQQKIRDLQGDTDRQGRHSKETGMVKVLQDQRRRIFVGRVMDHEGQHSAKAMVEYAIAQIMGLKKVCSMSKYLFEVIQILPMACIITASTPNAARDLMILLREFVKKEGWRVMPAIPNSPDIKQIVMAVDSILGRLKTKKEVKNWNTYFGLDQGVYRIRTIVRYEEGQEVRLDIKADIYKPNDSREVILKNVAANMTGVVVDEKLQECVREILTRRAAGNARGAESGARGRLNRTPQRDQMDTGSSPPPPSHKESTPIATPPAEDILGSTEDPPLPFRDNVNLGLMTTGKIGEKAKPGRVGHHKTIVSETSANEEEEMDGIEMEKQKDKDSVVQMVKDGLNNKRKDKLDKSIENDEGVKKAKQSVAEIMLSKV